MTDIEHVDLEAIVRWQEAFTPKARTLRKGLSHWWLDVHEGVGIQPGTRNEIQRAVNDMKIWLDAIESLATDEPQEQEHEMPDWAQPQ